MYAAVAPPTELVGAELPTCEDQAEKEKPKSSSSDFLERFAALKARRERMTRRSTAARVKSLQKESLKRVSEELQNGDDREVIEEHGVRLPLLPHQKRRKPTENSSSKVRPAASEEWQRLRLHMDKNEHLAGCGVVNSGIGSGNGKSELELRLQKHLDAKQFEQANEVSDRLARGQLAVRIADAAQHRDATERKRREQEEKANRKRQRLSWRFDSKQRWERKGNM